jgi:hypothetical protein
MSYESSSIYFTGARRPSRFVRLNAASGGAGPFPLITTLLADPIPVVAVTIDTTGMRSPVILLHYTSVVCLPLGVSITLNFEIKRSFMDGAAVCVGPTQTFSTLVTALEAESFAFQYFDSNLAPGVYTYSIQLSTNSVVDITPGMTINNAVLSALAVDNEPC